MVSGGIRDLRRIQIGKEVYGYATPVDPTTQLVGGMGVVENRNRIYPGEATGIMSAARRVYDQAVQAELAFDAGEEGATFEQLIILLSMGICGGVTPTPVGALGYNWLFRPDLANGDVPDIYTIRIGDNRYCWEAEGVFARELHLSGATQESWKLTADLFGDQLTPAVFETIAYPTPLETILAQMTRLYLNDTWAGLGGTLVEATLIEWEITIPGYHAKFFQDGRLVYSDIGLASRSLAITMTLEFNALAVAEWLDWQAATPRFIRLLAEGSRINPAPAVDVKEAQIDMCVIWEKHETLDERDGNDIIRFTGRTVYDATSGREFEVSVQNTIDNLPS
jgi:hypothetical protein